MKTNNIRTLICLGVAILGSPVSLRAEDAAAKELKQLEGVWASKPPEKGRGRGHVFYLQGGKLGWESFQTRDGQAVIGHAKLYTLEVDPKASPKKLTIRRGKDEESEKRLGIYELDGDTLKVAFASGKDDKPPTKFSDDAAESLVLRRDKEAKIPKLDDEEPKEVRIKPTTQWLGQIADKLTEAKCKTNPITTAASFESIWKLLRGAEKLPNVDFKTQFVLVRTSSAKLLSIGLILVGTEVDDHLTVEARSKVDGFTYSIAVFQRDLVDVRDGQVIPKKKK